MKVREAGAILNTLVGKRATAKIQWLPYSGWAILAAIVTGSDTQALFSVSLGFSSIPSTDAPLPQEPAEPGGILK